MPRAVVCRGLGPPERLRLETFVTSPLKQGEVRIAVHAAGINFPDILMAAGEYQLKPELPFTPGVEAAGDVIEVNGAASVAVGDRVIVKMRHGAYADEAVVTASQLAPLPSTFDYAEGATFLAAHGTAYHALIDRGQRRADQGRQRARRPRRRGGTEKSRAWRSANEGVVAMGGGGKSAAKYLAPVATRGLRAGDAASHRSQSHRACGVDDALTPSLRAKRSNPALPRRNRKLDCFVASAPRNDGLNYLYSRSSHHGK